MKYVIVGAPGTGKEEVGRKLWVKTDIEPVNVKTDDIGFLADYREELSLATSRALFPGDDPSIQYHSLIDSVSYAALRLTGLLNYDRENQEEIARWAVVFDACVIMLNDGYDADTTLYIPYKGDDQDSKDLDEALRATLDAVPIAYKVIDPEAEVDTWISS